MASNSKDCRRLVVIGGVFTAIANTVIPTVLSAIRFPCLLFCIGCKLIIAATPSASFRAVVVRVVSGDQLEIKEEADAHLIVKLYGIAGPSEKHPLGQKARENLRRLAEGQTVSVERLRTVSSRQIVGRVIVADLDLSMEQLRMGLVWWDRGNGMPFSELGEIEASARDTGLGLWGQRPSKPPTEPFKAASWYQASANRGNPTSQYELGIRYFNGVGVPMDKIQAAKWIRMAAVAGLPNAQSFLGSMYRLGEGTERSPEEALKWFRLAADQGQPHAQLSLGEMHQCGEGVPRDLLLAYLWVRRAEFSGNPNATRVLHFLQNELTPDQKATAEVILRTTKVAPSPRSNE